VAASRLNSPRFSSLVIRRAEVIVNCRLPIANFKSASSLAIGNRQLAIGNENKCSVLSVSMTNYLNLTHCCETNKYSISNNLQSEKLEQKGNRVR
jgi:hypothetical protein